MSGRGLILHLPQHFKGDGVHEFILGAYPLRNVRQFLHCGVQLGCIYEINHLLKAHAVQQGISMADLIRQVLTQYLEDEGERITQMVEWGGNRHPERDSDDE